MCFEEPAKSSSGSKNHRKIASNVASELEIEYLSACNFTKAVIAFMDLFGVVLWHDDGLCQIGGQVQNYFINSLNWYFENNQHLMSNWESIGTSDEIKINNLLESSPYFLQIMEKRRLWIQKRTNLKLTPSRNQVVSVVMVKGLLNGKSYFLHQWDKDSKQFQIIGGKQRINEDHFETAKRELMEELCNLNLMYDRDYTLELLNQNNLPLKNIEISRTYGALTAYKFWIYAVKFRLKNLQLPDMDRWISLDEMRQGKTYNGKKVIDTSFYRYRNLPRGLEYVPLSINLKETKKYMDFINVKPRIWFFEFDLKKLILNIRNNLLHKRANDDSVL